MTAILAPVLPRVHHLRCAEPHNRTSSSNMSAESCNTCIRNTDHERFSVLNQRFAFLKELEHGSGNLHIVRMLVRVPFAQKSSELSVAGFGWQSFQLHQSLEGISFGLLHLWGFGLSFWSTSRSAPGYTTILVFLRRSTARRARRTC